MTEPTPAETTTGRKRDDPNRAHLAGIADGCGCVEVWEHLNENRED